MQTKNIVIVASLTVTSLLFGLFWVVAPALMKDKIIGLVTSTHADRQCFNYYKKNYFKDPDSAYIESSRILAKEHDEEELSQYPLALNYNSMVQVKVLARNSMGGYGATDIICPLMASNTFDEIETTLYLLKVANEKSTKELCTKIVNLPQASISDDTIKYRDRYCSNYF